MSWPSDHKSKTRARIVEAAAAAFRSRGIADVRVEDVMAGAGLTHGGFYAHFASKDDLLRESLDFANDETVAWLSKSLASLPDADRLHAVIEAYLSPVHVAHPEHGCPLAALGPEIARAGGASQRQLSAAVRARVAWMHRVWREGRRDAVSEDHLMAALACLIGAVILARAVGGKRSTIVLDACRELLLRALGSTAQGSGAPRRPAGRSRTNVRATRQRREARNPS